ncbi:MAG: SusD/RagB family nutrient-binding outer membrane lipoprotein [Flavobacteriaceae bacterium]
MLITILSCSEKDFSENYADPGKIANSTVEKQFAGFLQANKDYVLPAYTNYFVVLRTTLSRFNQVVGWTNGNNQYVPGEAGIKEHWDNYYGMLAQYRELEKIYQDLTAEEQADKRIFMIAATIYLYDHTQRLVDLHGAVPFSKAGMLSQNGGDYISSLPAYDSAETVYTTLLDGLKSMASELNSITLSDGVQLGFSNQDFVNGGDLTTWKKYCNSLRLRMLTRVSASSEFGARAQSEISEILSNPGTYPTVDDNAENVDVDVTNLDSPINSKSFENGFESWNGNLAGKVMIDHMNTNADPRLRALFEPGESAEGAYIGLDPTLNEPEQTAALNTGTISLYNRSTLSRNQYFPGMLMSAAEVSFLKAEAYLGTNDAMAKQYYEMGIEQSIDFYFAVRELSNDNTAGALAPTDQAEIDAYVAAADVSWDDATSEMDKLKRIATQKWIHFNVVQMYEGWAEIRRLDLPGFDFWLDTANAQTLPPTRWIYPSSERVYNTDNYNAVSGQDNLDTKLFWDIN